MVAPAAPAPPLPRVTGWLVAVVATLAMTVSYIDRQALSQLAPTVREALHIDNAQYGRLTAAFSVAYLVGAPLAGWLLDRIGTRRGLVASVLVWSVVSALHAIAPSFAVLVLLRVALGFAEAPSFPGAARTIRQALPPSDRSAGFGLIFTGSSIGGMIAAPLAIGLKVHFGWQLAFVGTSLCGLLWLPLWLVATGGARKAALEQRRVDAPRVDVPWREVFRDPAVRRAAVFILLIAPLPMFVFNWSAQLLVDHFHEKQDDLARFVWIPLLAYDAGAVGFGWLASVRDRASFQTRSHVLYVFAACALGSTIALVGLMPSATWAMLMTGVAMMGAGGLYALPTADMMARVSPEISARAGGCTAASQSLSIIVAAPLIGSVLERTHSYPYVLTGIAALLLPAWAIWARWPMRPQASATC
jgi:MFS transporter, ACS family, hexuronate transporter